MPKTVTLAEYLVNLEKRLQKDADARYDKIMDSLKVLGSTVQTDFTNVGRSVVAIHNGVQESLDHVSGRLDQLSNRPNGPNNSLCDSDNIGPNTSATLSHVPTNTIIYAQPPMVPKFLGNKTKNAMKFLEELEIYFRKANTPMDQRLVAMGECFEGPASDWHTIYLIAWQNYGDFKKDFIHCYWSKVEQDQLRSKLSSDVWENNTSMVDHFSQYIGLARLLTESLSEENLVSQLIKHFPSTIQSLWFLNNDRTVAGTADFLRQQESVTNTVLKTPRTDSFSGERHHPYAQINKTWQRGNIEKKTLIRGTKSSLKGPVTSRET